MCPDASDVEPAPTHAPRRVRPAPRPAPRPRPALAWTECEDAGRAGSSPGESKRLLGPMPPPAPPAKCRLQAGLTLGLWGAPRKHNKYPQTTKFVKTKYEKRKEKLLAVLKPPYFILSMIIIVVCIYTWGSERVRAQLEWSPGAWRHEPWRLFTYGCVHASAGHLALNALVALTVGWRLEQEQSTWRVMVVWCGGVGAGALGAGALQPHVRVVGASAAVYALLTAHLPNVVHRFGHIPLWWFRPLSVVVLAASEGCWALLRPPAPLVTSGAQAHVAYEHVAWAAHVFGAAVGIPLGFLVFTGENSSKRHAVVCRIVSLALLAGGVAAACVHYACVDDSDIQRFD